jgi:spoIIIJ-associated protein
MSREVSVEATGETVGEAKWKALRDLGRIAPGLDKSSVRFQVVSEGERGLLGVGYVPARVIASAEASDEVAAPQATPHDESDEATHVRAIVERVVGAMGIGTRVELRESGEEIFVTCVGGDVGLLIGKHGQTIDALQYVLNASVHRHGGERSVTVDAAGGRPCRARGARAARADDAGRAKARARAAQGGRRRADDERGDRAESVRRRPSRLTSTRGSRRSSRRPD